MQPPPDDSPSQAGRNTYHHGNLREALIDAALRLIAERGPQGFTFAEAARAAGVSPAAPYRHFRDRNALVAEVARLGFTRLAETLERAWAQGRPDPVTAIEACGRAYLDFARREPAAYAAMFMTGVAPELDPPLALAADRAFGVMRRAAELACASFRGPGARPPAMMVALHLWAMAHGVASLFIGRGDGTAMRAPISAEDLLESGLLVYLQSLGLSPPLR